MLLTVKETAEILKTNRNYVYTLIKENKLPAKKIGSIKIRKEDLEEFIKRSDYGRREI